MGNIKCANRIIIDFDKDTAFLLWQIISSAITASIKSGLPIDPKCYPSIEKLKTLSELNGLMTIELSNVIQVDADCMKYKGIKGIEEI